MIQEYLFITDEYKDEIKNSAIDETVKKEIITIQNSSCWMLYLYADGENEQVARKLDLIILKYVRNLDQLFYQMVVQHILINHYFR